MLCFGFNLGFKELEIIFLVGAGFFCACARFLFHLFLEKLELPLETRRDPVANGEMLDDASQIVPGGLDYCHDAT